MRPRELLALASFAGVAPIEVSSGDVVRHRLSRAGDRQLNRALHVIAITQIRRDNRRRGLLPAQTTNREEPSRSTTLLEAPPRQRGLPNPASTTPTPRSGLPLDTERRRRGHWFDPGVANREYVRGCKPKSGTIGYGLSRYCPLDWEHVSSLWRPTLASPLRPRCWLPGSRPDPAAGRGTQVPAWRKGLLHRQVTGVVTRPDWPVGA
ncbi:transposase [Micromonospora chersina]|uniref:transposase n=1 Tax=Micromonospora chersina TaxID=47854 RepID=UPI003F4CBC10